MRSDRKNPFQTQTKLLTYNSQPNNGYDSYTASISAEQVLQNSPFQAYKFEDVFKSAQHHKIYSYGLDDHLSRYDCRMKLREIDGENWKRQYEKQEKYKLDHFGPEALRYKSYSTGHSSSLYRSFQPLSDMSLQKNKPQKSNILHMQQHFPESRKISHQNSAHFGGSDSRIERQRQSEYEIYAPVSINKYAKPISQSRDPENEESARKMMRSMPNTDYFGHREDLGSKGGKHFVENSFSKNQEIVAKETARSTPRRRSDDSDSDMISEKLAKEQPEKMSYGSNFDKFREPVNFDDSDHINDESMEIESKPMKYSSSSDEYYKRKPKPSNFGVENHQQHPDRIIYSGKEYYQLKIF